jgi:hypothetical protein
MLRDVPADGRQLIFLLPALQVRRRLDLYPVTLVDQVESVPLCAPILEGPQRRADQELGEDTSQVVGQDVRERPGPEFSERLTPTEPAIGVSGSNLLLLIAPPPNTRLYLGFLRA